MAFWSRRAGMLAAAMAALGSEEPVAAQSIDRAKRQVTVADTIRMTKIGGPLEASLYFGVGPKTGFAVFSPNGKRFAVVTRTGNLKTSANDYSILLFRTADVSRGAPPKKLITFSSSSNEDGISNLNWLSDNDTILFLGSRGVGPTGVYSIQCSSGKLQRVTTHGTSLVSYAIAENGEEIVYAAKAPSREVISDDVMKHGFEVATELLPDLVMGEIKPHELELYVKRRGVADYRLPSKGPLNSGVHDLFLSPDGRYLLLKTSAPELQEIWRRYKDENIQVAFRGKLSAKTTGGILQYRLLDLKKGESDFLLNAPAPYATEDVFWSPDSKSVLLCGSYLPLDVDDPVELQARQENKFVAEVNVLSRTIVKISSQPLRPVRWDAKRNMVQFYSRWEPGQINARPEPVYYRKTARGWEQVFSVPKEMLDVQPDIRVQEDLNMAPRIVSVSALTGSQTTLLELNPQFAELRLGRVQEIQWTDGKGRLVTGGLFFPPDYIPGRRYPLVIQTHGFDPHAFWIDGPWPTAFAAQPLANRDIIVLQVNDNFRDSLGTAEEMQRALSSYEGAIAYLDSIGIVDPARIGLIGFSRTCLYVKYALTHSRYRFAAALTSDGFDGGYFEYLVLANAVPLAADQMETFTGAAPFGAGISLWLKNSPGFSLDKVTTPVQLEANTPGSLFNEWEWFSGLRRLDKAVDLLYLPAGTHILTKPSDRLVSQTRTVDWFCFWLKDEEDRDSAKIEQYSKWRDLRMRSANPRPH